MEILSQLIQRARGVLLLEDGQQFWGTLMGAKRKVYGEVVFNTAMAGYQEVLTDPSYTEQIVVMTYPHQGNYGLNSLDNESENGPKLAGFVVHELCLKPSNFTSEQSLNDYLIQWGIGALTGVDTRALTLHLRDHGCLRGLILSEQEFSGLIGTGSLSVSQLFDKYPAFVGRDLTASASTKKVYDYNQSGSKRVVVYDFGVKTNLLREIAARGYRVTVVPAQTSAREVLAMKPQGVFLSNGPGDPSAAQYAVENIKELLGVIPMFGVCMGHQLLGIALGGRTFKMKFGHRGVNQPVLREVDRVVEISSHNHGYALAEDGLPAEVKITHRSLNDQTVEGIECLPRKCFSVQYHPESAPGPHDSGYLFDQFARLIDG